MTITPTINAWLAASVWKIAQLRVDEAAGPGRRLLQALCQPSLYAKAAAVAIVGGVLWQNRSIARTIVVDGAARVLSPAGLLLDRLASRTGEACSHAHSNGLRYALKGVGIPRGAVDPTHSHPHAAAARSAVVAAMHVSVANAGLVPYSWSTSPGDQRAGIDGLRQMYWAKDLRQKCLSDPILPHHAIVMVDVDFHAPMPELLHSVIAPYLLYTVAPQRAGGVDGNSSYCFLADGRFSSRVDGGATYAHRLFDYGHDTIVAANLASAYPVYVVYSIERVTLSDTRCVVALSPQKVWRGLWAWLIAGIMRLRGDSTPRLDVVRAVTSAKTASGERYVRLTSGAATNSAVSIGITSVPDSVRIPHVTDAMFVELAARIGQQARSVALVSGTIASHLRLDERVDATTWANVLVGYYTQRVTVSSPHVPIGAPALEVYQANTRQFTFDDASKSGVIAIAAPICVTPTAPDDSPANKAWSVESRINTPQAESIVKPTKWLYRAMSEFADHIIRDVGRHTLKPASIEEVMFRQPSPTQSALVDAHCVGNDKPPASHFIKQESGTKFSAPRIITPVGKGKVVGAQFMYALSDALKSSALGVCMASGLDPASIAQRLAWIGQHSRENLLESDANRMDGHVNELCRVFERSVVFGLFAPVHHAQLDEALQQQYGFGVRYAMYDHDACALTRASRASGAAETSVFNTLLTLFVAYCAYRTKFAKTDNPSGLAYAALLRGVVALGDDSVVADVPSATLEHAARSVGQSYAVRSVAPADRDPSIEFLSRHYHNVFFGSADNCAVLPRAVIKATTCAKTPGLDTSFALRLFEKARSILVNDSDTPILGEFASRIIELAPEDWLGREADTRLWSYASRHETCYPNADREANEVYARAAMPTFDFEGFRAWLESASSIEELMNCPGFDTAPARVDGAFTVNGESLAPFRSTRACQYDAVGTCMRDECPYVHAKPFGREAGKAARKAAALASRTQKKSKTAL